MKAVSERVLMLAAVVASLMIVGCGKEKERDKGTVPPSQNTQRASPPPPEPSPVQPQGQPAASAATSTPAGNGTPQNSTQGTITAADQAKIETLIATLRNLPTVQNSNTNQNALIPGLDPKLATALLQCPGVLLGGAQNLGVLSVLTGLLGGQGLNSLGGNPQTAQQNTTSSQQQLPDQVVDVTSCLLKAFL